MPVLETIALNLAATGLTKGGSRGSRKVRDILRRRQFSAEIDDLEAELNRALRNRITESVAESDDIPGSVIAQNWSDIAAQLNEIQVVFETEEEAVRRIASAIATGIQDKTNDDDITEEDFEGVVTAVYRDVIRTFANNISGTELADTLGHEADIELTTRVSELTARLEEMESRHSDFRDAALRDIGFIRLSDQYFEQQTPDSPARCWRTGFELSEVNAGYAITREARRDDGVRYEIPKELTAELRDGNDCVVLGPPGSGKSTICKQVACQWYRDGNGDTFYRRSDRSESVSNLGTLEERIRSGAGVVLVVVEDAVRDETVDILECIREFRHDDQVAFLLDSREGEWHGSDTKLADARLQEIKDRELNHHTIPRLDEYECERIIKHFESTTEATVADSPVELFEAVNSASGVGEVLQFSYHLSFYTSGPTGEERLTNGITSLEKSVQNVLERQYKEDDDGLSIRLGALLNLLNASDIGVHPELLYVLADNDSDRHRIDELLERYEGELVFADSMDIITDQTDPLRANHEFWSTLYLEALLDHLGSRRATRVFESCLADLFEMVDNAHCRRETNRWFREEMPFFTDLESNSTEVADDLVESVFQLGRRQPNLAPLYGTTNFTEATIPDICSADLEARTALWRGIMYYHSGDFESAERELEGAQSMLEESPKLSTEARHEIDGWCGNYLGSIMRDRGFLDNAKELHHRSQNLLERTDDPVGVAFSLYNIGKLYWVKSDYGSAKRYLEEALEEFRKVGDRRYVSVTLNTIGLVLRDRGDFDEAEQRLNISLANAQAAGDERSEGRCLNHLGEVNFYRGNLSAAEEYYRQALKLARKVGDKQGETWMVHNLGNPAQTRGELDRALELFNRSRELEQEMGNKRGEAISLNYTATINHIRGNYEIAIENVREGLELVDEVGDRRRRAELLKTRGIIAKNRGRLKAAEEYLSDSLGIFEAVGDRGWQADVLIELGSVAIKSGSTERAAGLYEDALRTKQKIGDQVGESQSLGGIGLVAQQRGQYEVAKALFEKSRDIAENIGDLESEAYSLSQLGDLARERGEFEEASNYFDQSQELFSTIGDIRRQAQIKYRRGHAAQDEGDLQTAREWLQSALATYNEIDDQFGRARTLSRLTDIAQEQGDKEASDHLKQAVAAFENVGATSKTIDHIEDLIELRERRGEPVVTLQSKIRNLQAETREGET